MEDSTLVTFEVTATVALGETVCICGDHAELGNFNRNTAKEMVTDPASYPVWRLNVILPKGVPRKYKFLTMGFRQFREWKPITDKVRTFTPDGETMIIRDDYGKFIKQPERKERSTTSNSLSSSAPTAMS